MYQAIHLSLCAESSRELNLVTDIKPLIALKLAFSHISNAFESIQKF